MVDLDNRQSLEWFVLIIQNIKYPEIHFNRVSPS